MKKEIYPPAWPLRFLRFLCREDLLEEIEGDLLEEFLQDLESRSLKVAKKRHVLRALGFIRWYALKRKRFIHLENQCIMLRNFIVIAFRVMKKHAGYTAINIAGLSFGLFCFMLMVLYVQDEQGFDSMYSNNERIYRVVEETLNGQGEPTRLGSVAFSPAPLGMENIPAIENATRMLSIGRVRMYRPETEREQYTEFTITEPSFFKIFDMPWVNGYPQTALQEPNTVVLAQSLAEKLFGKQDPIGEQVMTDRRDDPFTVVGVIEDFPNNTHLAGHEALFSMATMREAGWYQRLSLGDWATNYFSTYFKLSNAAQGGNVEAQLNDLAIKNSEEGARDNRAYALQPLRDIHFHSADVQGGYNYQPGNIHYVYTFLIVGVLVLLLASVNYTSLAASRGVKRSREIGIRKASGAKRSAIIAQLLIESVMVSLLAAIIALILVMLVLPTFNAFTGKVIVLSTATFIGMMLFCLGVALFTGLLSGTYPALVISKLNPALILKAAAEKPKGGRLFTNGLVVGQFVVSTVLVVVTLSAYAQLEFLSKKDLGFDQELVLVTDINTRASRTSFQAIKDRYAQINGVKSVSVSSRVPGEWKNLPTVLVEKHLKTTEEQPIRSFFIGADEDFLATFDIQLVNGKNFMGGLPSDSSSVIINQKAAEVLGLKEAEGQQLVIPQVRMNTSDTPLREPFQVRVLGIVEDFHFQSLHEEVEPLIIAYHNNPVHNIDYFTLKLEGNALAEVVPQVKDALHEIDPEHLFEYHFLDEQLAAFYEADAKRGIVFGLSAGTALFIACLGLFALASFASVQRRKEIGIRKTFGASTTGITFLLSKQFTKLVILSFVFAFPLGWWLTDWWLQSFAYRITIHWSLFVFAGVLTLFIALGSVFFQTVQAALANPVKTLRSE